MNTILETFVAYPVLAWAGVGLALLAVEILLPQGFFLSFAAAGFLVAAFAALAGEVAFVWLLVAFAAVGVGLILPMRLVLRRYFDRTPDINSY